MKTVLEALKDMRGKKLLMATQYFLKLSPAGKTTGGQRRNLCNHREKIKASGLDQDCTHPSLAKFVVDTDGHIYRREDLEPGEVIDVIASLSGKEGYGGR